MIDNQLAPTIYKLKFWHTFAGLINAAVIAVSILGFVTCALGGEGSLAVKLIPVSIITILLTYVLIPAFIATFATHLEISDEGIIYKHWPFYSLSAAWDQLAEIKKFRWTKSQLLLLNDAKIKRNPLFPLRGGRYKKHYWIRLTDFKGWPDGELAEDIRTHAPHLFDVSPDSPPN